jgi:hypothetical protein
VIGKITAGIVITKELITYGMIPFGIPLTVLVLKIAE